MMDLDGVGVDAEAIEDGETFEANASKKARFFAALSGLPTLADDSGLEVDALGGGPGVRTRRYAGENATDDTLARWSALVRMALTVPAAQPLVACQRMVRPEIWPEPLVRLKPVPTTSLPPSGENARAVAR